MRSYSLRAAAAAALLTWFGVAARPSHAFWATRPFAAAPELSTGAADHDARAAQRTVRATSAWIAPSASGTAEATAFVVIENGTMYDVFVVGVQSDSAGSAELRQVQASGTAAALAEAPVPAFGQLEMSAKGVHIVLKELKSALKAGETVTLVLALDSGDRLTVSAAVK